MPLTAKGETILASLEKEHSPEKAKSILYAGENKGTFTGIHSKSDSGLVMGSPPGSPKADMGPGHEVNHPGKDAEYHYPVSDDASPLARAEAAYDDARLLEAVSQHCDSIARRLDDCEKGMVRNGEEKVMAR